MERVQSRWVSVLCNFIIVPPCMAAFMKKKHKGFFLPFFSGYSRVTLICHDWDISLVSRHKATLSKRAEQLEKCWLLVLGNSPIEKPWSGSNHRLLLSGLWGACSASNPNERNMNSARLEINVDALLGILTTPPSLLAPAAWQLYSQRARGFCWGL